MDSPLSRKMGTEKKATDHTMSHRAMKKNFSNGGGGIFVKQEGNSVMDAPKKI